MNLIGPHPFDLTAPAQSARLVISAWASGSFGAHEDLEPSDGASPGLYLLVEGEALVGFWLTFGESYLDDGPGPGRVPPYAEHLLEAATEEIWWERMNVTPKRGTRWSPIVVLEWPPALAERSGSPPPGVEPLEEDIAPEASTWVEDEDTTWLNPLDVGIEAEPTPVEPVPSQTAVLYRGLPHRRSVVTLVRGTLARHAGVHEGRYELAAVDPDAAIGPQGVPLETWTLEAEPKFVRDEQEGWAKPLQLPGGRTGFPLAGWLARDLEPTPADPSDRLPGELVARDIQSRLWSQLALAVLVTTVVVVGVLLFSETVHLASRPFLETAAAVPPVHAQPAMSVCSADHRRFVEAFRCQVRHLANGGTPGEADCTGPDPGDDLQPAYCGLHDRTLDGWADPEGHGYAELAAASACFSVLGAPWPYAAADSQGERPDPARLLEDPQLKVASLEDLVSELDVACKLYRDKLESRVSAGVLATHVGDRSREGDALRDLVFNHATKGLSVAQRACWSTGRDAPADRSTALLNLCGEDPAETVLQKRKSWLVLAGDAEVPVTGRYVEARFGNAGTERGLWACHRELAEGLGGSRIRGLWDLDLPHPQAYGSSGITSQLRLDAGLQAMRAGGSAVEVCWRTVDGMIGGYEPVHPVLEPTKEGAWPSTEQQVCGQACAAAYGLADRPGDWVTPGTDLAVCVSSAPPVRVDSGRLDVLTLPWNADSEGTWIQPSQEDVCAFNLIAQGRLGALVDDQSAPLWAGEFGAGSGIAGGPDGGAYLAAEALGTYGRNRSTSTCAQVAAQCFAGELLTVLADGRTETHEWRAAWRRKVAEIPRVRPGEVRSPWCRLIRPYLQEDGSLPEGEFDFPCALGVDRARQQLENQIAQLATGSFAGSAE